MAPTLLSNDLVSQAPYNARDFSQLRGLRNIPDPVIRAHLLHYENSVRRLHRARESGMTDRVDSGLKDLRLHEFYFDNLSSRPSRMSRRFEFTLRIGWGSLEAWKDEFRALGRRDGVGWVILHMDPVEYQLSNHWVDLHGEGHPSGFLPVLVMDVEDHAFTGMDRSAYIEAFLENVDWARVEDRHAVAENLDLRGYPGHASRDATP